MRKVFLHLLFASVLALVQVTNSARLRSHMTEIDLKLSTVSKNIYLDSSDFVHQYSDDQDSDSDSREQLRMSSIKLKKEVVSRLSKEHPGQPLNLTAYHIENWPDFVAYSYRTWTAENIAAIRDTLPRLKFKKLPPHLSGPNNEHRANERAKINKLLNQKYFECSGERPRSIPWSKFDVHGWPVGVSTRSDRWNFGEFFAIFKNMSNIHFVLFDGHRDPIINYAVEANEEPKSEQICRRELYGKQKLDRSACSASPSETLRKRECFKFDFAKSKLPRIEKVLKPEFPTRQSSRIVALKNVKNVELIDESPIQAEESVVPTFNAAREEFYDLNFLFNIWDVDAESDFQ